MKMIAVVEDNADNRLLLRAFLGDRYEITEYENGHAALEGFAKQRPELVLLDVSLPGMDGLAVLSHIRASDTLKTLPVIALTAHAMHGDRERFLKSGFNDYVSKPIIDENILLSAIEQWIQ